MVFIYWDFVVCLIFGVEKFWEGDRDYYMCGIFDWWDYRILSWVYGLVIVDCCDDKKKY